jgi:hypothetical protein
VEVAQWYGSVFGGRDELGATIGRLLRPEAEQLDDIFQAKVKATYIRDGCILDAGLAPEDALVFNL